MMNAYDLFECFEFFICEKIFLKQWLEQKRKHGIHLNRIYVILKLRLA